MLVCVTTIARKSQEREMAEDSYETQQLNQRLTRIERAIRLLTRQVALNRFDVVKIESALIGTDATLPDWRDGPYHGGAKESGT